MDEFDKNWKEMGDRMEKDQKRFDKMFDLFWRVFPWVFVVAILLAIAKGVFYAVVAWKATPVVLQILEKFAH